ncbi:MAG: penicillin-binding protein 2 [Endomicrobia bacterium]|nr:penicillin-binding protein 2 [Endomicrobiia bacterium]
MNKIRFNIVRIILLFIVPAVIIIRLFSLQIWYKDKYQTRIKKQINSKLKVNIPRGDILDKNNKILATSIEVASVYINSKPFIEGQKLLKKNDVKKNLSLLCSTFNLNENKIEEICRKYKRYCLIENAELKEIINLENIPGIEIFRYMKRVYPYGEKGSYIIGRVDEEGKPYSGIELEFNDVLEQTKIKEISIYKSGGFKKKSIRLANLDDVIEFTENNKNPTLILTLDFSIQTRIENVLKKYLELYKPNLMMCIVQDVNTGEIISMSTLPETSTPYKDPNITNLYEPGSVFKIFPMAIFLEENITNDNNNIDCENGNFIYNDIKISDVKPHKYLTLEQIMAYSSNIGMVKLYLKYSHPTNFFKYLTLFGFGNSTGIELSIEQKGMLTNPSQKLSLSAIYATFGQGISVTNLQIVNGYTMIANSGELLQPYIVKEIVDTENNIIYQGKRKVIRSVLSKETCNKLKDMLYKTVEYGTAKGAKIQNIKICAKTGTAQKYDPKLKKYSPNRYFMSCCGFFPYENPKYTIGIFVDEPKRGSLASEVAVPIFRDIILELVNHKGIFYAQAN